MMESTILSLLTRLLLLFKSLMLLTLIASLFHIFAQPVLKCVYVYTISLIRKQLLSTRDNSQSDRHPWSFCMFACCSRAQSSQVLLDENQEQKNVVMRLSELYKYDAQPSYSDASIRLPLEVDGWMNGWNYTKFK